MSLNSYFAVHPICPGCHGAREIVADGLCATCVRIHRRTGRLPVYDQPVPSSQLPTTKVQPMFEPLFKRTSTGAVQIWQIRVEPQDDGTAVIVTTHGQVDGKPQEGRDTVRAGKNPGKKNATTPYQQAVKEAESKWSEKRDRGLYGLTIEESDIKRLFAPMKAQSWLDKNKNLTGYAKRVNWDDKANLFVQPKFDGHRSLAICDANGIRLFTKNGVPINTCEHLIDQLQSIMQPGMTLDGEIYTHGVPVTTIGGYISKKQPGTENLCMMTYDTFGNAPFAERIGYVEKALAQARSTHLVLARTQHVTTLDEMIEFQTECVEHGYEGAMLRHGTDGYENGDRSASILKIKTFTDEEFTIVGCKEGRGKFEGAAVFECVTADGHKFDCTAPGDMPRKRAIYLDSQQYIGKRLTIKYQRYTETAEPVPFQPVAKGFVD